ncbi:hypothetical protein GUJ93_ZPchr0010g9225 [Zizania palustris]|uniref:Uncharacterized protein n=1 Tax=Zizania palustris TaxID=103762 RepID=A0A8J5WFL2_ZIZPA|nr:hypothetical protein GUJ93_ZPchr0010g9225 [Zizania palustris]
MARCPRPLPPEDGARPRGWHGGARQAALQGLGFRRERDLAQRMAWRGLGFRRAPPCQVLRHAQFLRFARLGFHRGRDSVRRMAWHGLGFRRAPSCQVLRRTQFLHVVRSLLPPAPPEWPTMPRSGGYRLDHTSAITSHVGIATVSLCMRRPRPQRHQY